MKSLIISLAFLLFFSGCKAKPVLLRPALEEEGEVFIYLQPVPQEGQRLRFIIDGISAIREESAEVALSLAFNELKGSELVGVQKLLASGVLEPGLYRGVSVKVKNAFVEGEEGEAALLVPEEPVTIEQGFRVRRRKALALFLTFDPYESIKDGFSFTPVFSLASPGMELADLTGYVSNSDSNIISVFNKKTMLVVGAIATGRAPVGIALDQRRRRAYVAVSGEDSIKVVDVFAGEEVSRIRLNIGDEPRELDLTPDGGTLVTANSGSNTASIVDTFSLFEVKRVKVGEGPYSVVVDRSGLRAYVMNSLSNTVSVIDLSRNKLSATIPVGETPLRGAFNRRGDRLYVISRYSPDLTVIDPQRLAVSGKIFVGTGAVSLLVDTRTDLVLVGKVGGEISVIDPSASMFIDVIQTGGDVAFMSIDDEENALFVAIPESKALQKFNLVSKKVMAEIEVLEGAYAVAVMGER